MLSKTVAAWILMAAGLAAQTVDGYLINRANGSGLPGINVSLLQGGSIPYSATTDQQGHFTIEAVKDGSYRALYKVPRGFWPAFHGGGRRLFQVAAGAGPVHLTVEMLPIPEISGDVLDAGGKPVPNATLFLQLMNPAPGMVLQKKAGEKGEFSIADLPLPGAWLLSAVAPESQTPPEPADHQRLGWAQTFYPGVTERDLAVKLILPSGHDLWNMDIKLAAVPVHRVRGVVLDLSGDPVPTVPVSMGHGAGSPIPKQDTRGDGTFEFISVPEGEWHLAATLRRDNQMLRADQEVQVKDQDVENVKLRLVVSFSLPGKIVIETPEAAPATPPPLDFNFTAVFATTDLPPDGGIGKPDRNGDFSIGDLFPGVYRIIPGIVPLPYYLDSIRLGERDVLASDVQIPSGAQPLVVTYKMNGGTVRGSYSPDLLSRGRPFRNSRRASRRILRHRGPARRSR